MSNLPNKQFGDNPTAVLQSLQLQDLDDDEDEPWTPIPMRVRERRDFLCRSVRAVARLVGSLDDAALQCYRELRQPTTPPTPAGPPTW
eukprot:5819742-Prymnesium_polylepis.1